jgi:hypothetical protein
MHIHLFLIFLPISFINISLNMWVLIEVLCGSTYSMVDLPISCMEIDKRLAKKMKTKHFS